MKFVCDRCQTRYSIADEKVRQKILRIRCKTCGNVIVVQEGHPRGQTADDAHPPEAGRPASSGNLRAASASGPKVAPGSGRRASPASRPKPPPIPLRPPSSGPKPPPPPRPAKGSDPLGGHVEWYLAIDGEESGPFSRAEIAKRIQAAGPGKSVHVWKEGMASWKSPQEVSVVAHELSLLRPSPPRQVAAVLPTAPVGRADSEVTTTPLPLGGAATPRVTAEAPPTESTAPEASGFGDVTTKKGKELLQAVVAPVHDDFGEVTTKRTQDLREVMVAPSASSFTEATTKKGRNLHELEADAPTAPGAGSDESDRTPPPMKPLPPVGGKAPSSGPAVGRGFAVPMPDPVVSFETPTPAPRQSAALAIPGSPLAPAPAFKLPASPSGATGAVSPTSPLPPGPSGPSVPFAIPSVAGASPPGSSFAVPSTPRGPLLSPGDLPTPRPLNLGPFGDASVPLVLPEPPPAQGRIEGLFQRQPGLKYVVAALAIVGLIILLGLVILRGGDRVTDSEPAAQAEPEPAKAEEPKLAVAEPPPPPAPAPEEKPAPVAQPSVKPAPGGSGRSVRHAARFAERVAVGRAAPPRQGSERPSKDKAATPPRLAGARPNPFDESRNVSQAQITAVVRNPANQAALKSCYERALKMDNHLTSGRIDVTVSIASSGAVQRVVINAPASFILVEPCIKSAVKRWSFPPSIEDYGTSFPLIMQGGM
jgi:predicted Zn finger-like uncharacterized protein